MEHGTGGRGLAVKMPLSDFADLHGGLGKEAQGQISGTGQNIMFLLLEMDIPYGWNEHYHHTGCLRETRRMNGSRHKLSQS